MSPLPRLSFQCGVALAAPRSMINFLLRIVLLYFILPSSQLPFSSDYPVHSPSFSTLLADAQRIPVTTLNAEAVEPLGSLGASISWEMRFDSHNSRYLFISTLAIVSASSEQMRWIQEDPLKSTLKVQAALEDPRSFNFSVLDVFPPLRRSTFQILSSITHCSQPILYVFISKTLYQADLRLPTIVLTRVFNNATPIEAMSGPVRLAVRNVSTTQECELIASTPGNGNLWNFFRFTPATATSNATFPQIASIAFSTVSFPPWTLTEKEILFQVNDTAFALINSVGAVQTVIRTPTYFFQTMIYSNGTIYAYNPRLIRVFQYRSNDPNTNGPSMTLIEARSIVPYSGCRLYYHYRSDLIWVQFQLTSTSSAFDFFNSDRITLMNAIDLGNRSPMPLGSTLSSMCEASNAQLVDGNLVLSCFGGPALYGSDPGRSVTYSLPASAPFPLTNQST